MTAKFTIERILRDGDDASGRDIREWNIQCHDGHIFIRRREDGPFILVRAADVDILIDDLRRAMEMGFASGRTEAEEGVRSMRQSGDGFWECDTCAVKPGSPTLCNGCLHNRTLIERRK